MVVAAAASVKVMCRLFAGAVVDGRRVTVGAMWRCMAFYVGR